MSMIYFVLSWVAHDNSFITLRPGVKTETQQLHDLHYLMFNTSTLDFGNYRICAHATNKRLSKRSKTWADPSLESLLCVCERRRLWRVCAEAPKWEVPKSHAVCPWQLIMDVSLLLSYIKCDFTHMFINTYTITWSADTSRFNGFEHIANTWLGYTPTYSLSLISWIVVGLLFIFSCIHVWRSPIKISNFRSPSCL